MRLPIQASAAACIVSTIKQGQGLSPRQLEEIAQEVHKAAVEVLPDYGASSMTLKALLDTAHQVLEDRSSVAERGTTTTTTTAVPSIRPSTSRILQDLYAGVRQEAPESMQHVSLRVCFRVLELVCMAQEGDRCRELLRRGGSLVAAGVVAAAFCIAAPSTLPGKATETMRSALSMLAGYPMDLIEAQAKSYLALIFPSK